MSRVVVLKGSFMHVPREVPYSQVRWYRKCRKVRCDGTGSAVKSGAMVPEAL